MRQVIQTSESPSRTRRPVVVVALALAAGLPYLVGWSVMLFPLVATVGWRDPGHWIGRHSLLTAFIVERESERLSVLLTDHDTDCAVFQYATRADFDLFWDMVSARAAGRGFRLKARELDAAVYTRSWRGPLYLTIDEVKVARDDFGTVTVAWASADERSSSRAESLEEMSEYGFVSSHVWPAFEKARGSAAGDR